MRHLYYVTTALLAAGSLLASCGGQGDSTEKAGNLVARLTLVAPGGITPVPMPNPNIPGYTFPQDSSTIMGWLKANDSMAISRHGWGIWAALSSQTNQVLNGDTVRVFETWLSKSEVDTAHARLRQSPTALVSRPIRAVGRVGRTLQVPRQLLRDPRFTRRHARLNVRAMLAAPTNTVQVDSEQAVFEMVKYDPTAADTIINGKLFHASTLQAQLNQGRASIPEFRNTSVAVKPVYEIVPGPNSGVKGLYQMKVWSGPPSAAIPYDQPRWPNSVYVDINNKGKGHGKTSPGNAPATPATTYNLNDFIHFTLTAADTAALHGGQIGDYAILVAMHITTKEIKEWTWQTMWWAPNPNQVPRPSRASVVAARPQQLTGAPRHYAMAIAYQMISPNQPISGGTNQGQSLYVFNPYLEAGFSSATFSDTAKVITNNVTVVNNVGVRTNCMSCHVQASFTPLNSTTVQNPGYLGNTYVSLNDPRFKGNLRTDFLWSIADMASSPPDSAK